MTIKQKWAKKGSLRKTTTSSTLWFQIGHFGIDWEVIWIKVCRGGLFSKWLIFPSDLFKKWPIFQSGQLFWKVRVLEKWIFENFHGLFLRWRNLRRRLYVEIGDILQLLGYKMCSRKLLKLKGINESHPTAWGWI